MKNNKNDFNLNESNNLDLDNYSPESLKNNSNNLNLSDLDNKTTKDSSNEENPSSEPKNVLIVEKELDHYQKNNNPFPLNEDNYSLNDKSPTCEELHKEKVNIGNTDFSKPKKNHTLLNILLVILVLIIIFGVYCFVSLDNTKSLKSYFDDVDELRSVYSNTGCEFDTEGCDDDKTLQTKAITSLFDDMTIINDGTATINVSKSFIYTFITLDKINDLDFIKDNNIVVKQIGYDLNADDINNKYINIYGDLTYKGIKAGLTAQLSYEFKDDDLMIKFINAKIGNIPSFIYKNYLPKEGQILYQKDISYSVKLANDIDIKIFSPSEINRIAYDEKTGIISIDFNYTDALSNINNDLFNTENGSSKFNEILKYYLGNSADTIIDYIDDVGNYIKDNLGIDLNDINDYIKMFAAN